MCRDRAQDTSPAQPLQRKQVQARHVQSIQSFLDIYVDMDMDACDDMVRRGKRAWRERQREGERERQRERERKRERERQREREGEKE